MQTVIKKLKRRETLSISIMTVQETISENSSKRYNPRIIENKFK